MYSIIIPILLKPCSCLFIKIQYHLLLQCFGFQKNKSTSDAITDLVNKVVGGLGEREKLVSTILLDLSKAFDSVNIPIFKTNWRGMVYKATLQNFVNYFLLINYSIPKITLTGL